MLNLSDRILNSRLGTVAHTYNPSTLGGQGGWITWGQEFKTRLPTWQNPISTKNTKLSQAWWPMPVIPASQEAEAWESLKTRRQRLQWVEIAPLHSSLGDRARLCLNNNNNKHFHVAWPINVSQLLHLVFYLKKKKNHETMISSNTGGKAGWKNVLRDCIVLYFMGDFRDF